MIRKFALMVAAFAVGGSLTGIALAGADNYAFEAVKSEIKTSNVATIAVRLLHKPSGKPVTGAVIIQTRLLMPHEGSEMTSAIAPLPSPEPGVYAFMAPMTMAGRWVLSITARVEGESEMVTGTIAFRAAQ